MIDTETTDRSHGLAITACEIPTQWTEARDELSQKLPVTCFIVDGTDDQLQRVCRQYALRVAGCALYDDVGCACRLREHATAAQLPTCRRRAGVSQEQRCLPALRGLHAMSASSG